MDYIESKEILTPGEVMEMLDISRSTLQRLKKAGTLPSYRLSNKVFFKRSEIIAAVEAGKENPDLINQEILTAESA